MTGDSEMRNNSTSELNGIIDVEHYRKLVKQFLDMRRYQTALFWAEKVCCLSQNDPKDVYCQAQCMFLLKEYHRAAHTIRLHKLEKTHIPCYNLLLEALYEAKEFNEAIVVINTVDIEYLASSLINQPLDGGGMEQPSMLFGEESVKNEILASISFLKGKIYEAMDNRGLAMDYYVQALHKSVYCFEALDALVQHEMLMGWEEKELMQHLPLEQQSSESDAKLITKLYETQLKKYYESIGPHTNAEETPIGNVGTFKSIKELTEKIQSTRASDASIHKKVLPKMMTPKQSQIMSPANKVLEDLKIPPFSLQVSLTRASSLINDSQRSHMETPGKSRCKDNVDTSNALALSSCMSRIQKSTDVMAAEAEKLFYDCEYKKSFKILNELLKIDPYHNAALTLQIGCLVEFGDSNKLFYVAHKLVDRYPDKAISWYAVGCYYDLIGKSDPARRYLSKATSLDRLYGPAWLAYGHSFAKENEHDQAMAAYFKATQLMRGCHLPLLYIGVECGLTKNLELAEKFFYQAMSIAPLDVFVLHELGVIKYEYEYYESAEEVFRTTADIVKSRAQQNKEEVSSRWEPLFNNLGHCCRKNKKYNEALEFHQYALLLKPQSPQTYTAIGFIYALMDNLEEAITYFHKSLALNRDCIVTSTILKTCIEDFMDEESVMDEIYGKSSWNSSSSSSSYPTTKNANLFPPIEEEESATMKFTGMKLKFDDEDISANSDDIDPNLIMAMNMDI
ncbi:cell division cycle protein 16 homolog [Lucilia sericata]|uniref:cell division cycle protein 16 homolog n=1 Tax=Lucilia sericata TaxID=13632 RepID=UPI0018A81DE3|nr:cell division cycle protein 16 homolog [Lucilia sericata]XP_037810057.1 cell division cycle protein 16 homolog [Lucilia sericata]